MVTGEFFCRKGKNLVNFREVNQMIDCVEFDSVFVFIVRYLAF